MLEPGQGKRRNAYSLKRLIRPRGGPSLHQESLRGGGNDGNGVPCPPTPNKKKRTKIPVATVLSFNVVGGIKEAASPKKKK